MDKKVWNCCSIIDNFKFNLIASYWADVTLAYLLADDFIVKGENKYKRKQN
jgi:hypothetical protein